MRLLVISLLVAGCLRAQPASAAGVTVDQSGKPLAGVHIRLITGDFDSNEGVSAVYGADTDSAGHFSFDGIKSGLYLVWAERSGFIQKSTGPIGLLSVKPGQHLTDHKIVMMAQAIIQGHVTDEFGDPVQGVTVATQSAEPKQSQDFLFGGRNGMTNDRGEFRVFAGPGKYYLKVEQYQMQGQPQEIRTDGTPGGPFISTYYPSSATTAAASVVQVAAGQTIAGIEIRLLRGGPGSGEHTFTVSGTVIGTPENGQAMVTLHCGDHADALHETRGAQVNADGSFSVPGVRTGYCRASALVPSGKAPLQSRAVDLHVDADRTGVQLTLQPAEELIGKLELLGDTPPGAAEKRTVRLQAAGWNDGFGQTPPAAAEVGADGTFHISGIGPMKFKPVVEPMPENGYLKDVLVDGKAAPDGVLDFSQGVGGSRVKLTVSRSGGQISGRILGKDGEPAMGLMMVLFGTDPKHLDEENGSRSSDGRYSFKGIRPGKYRILALDIGELIQAFSGDGNEDETMKQLFDTAEEIEVKEGDHIVKDLSAITKMPEKKEEP